MELHQAAHQRQADARAPRTAARTTGVRPARTARRSGRSSPARSPMPVSSTTSRASSCPRPRAHRDAARRARCSGPRCAGGWRRPARAAWDRRARAAAPRRGPRTGRGRAPRAAGRAASTARARDLGEVHALLAQLDAPARDARDVEQVVHQPHHVPELAVHHLAHPLRDGIGEAARPLHLERVAQGSQRVAQLVPEHGQELVLGAAALRAARPPAASAPARCAGARGNGRCACRRVEKVCSRPGSGCRTSRLKNSATPSTSPPRRMGNAKAACSPSAAASGARGKFASHTTSGIQQRASPLLHTRPGSPTPRSNVPLARGLDEAGRVQPRVVPELAAAQHGVVGQSTARPGPSPAPRRWSAGCAGAAASRVGLVARICETA